MPVSRQCPFHLKHYGAGAWGSSERASLWYHTTLTSHAPGR